MNNKEIDLSIKVEKTKNSSGDYNFHTTIKSGEFEAYHHAELINGLEEPMLEPNLDIICESVKSIIREGYAE